MSYQFKLSVLAIVLFSFLMICCREHENDDTPKCLVEYSFTVSPDLLKFVTPQIKYTDEKGVIHTISDENELESLSVGVYRQTLYSDGYWTEDTISNTNCKTWTLLMTFKNFDFHTKFEVQYYRKEIIEDTIGKSYILYHSVEKKHSNVISNTDTIVSPTLDIPDIFIPRKGSAVKDYIEDLVTHPDKAGFYVDKEGLFTDYDNFDL